MEYKLPRGINSRSDSFKIWSGPLFRAIERRLFQHPAFIKHIPQRERPAYITELLGGLSCYFATDFTSFESSFTADVQDALECVLYDYMLQNFPDAALKIRQALSGVNVCKYHGFSLSTHATRMSGDMCTSLGNGFSNLMLVNYVASKLGGTVRGVVEGDDGLFGSNVPIHAEAFSGLGFDIKLERISDFRLASFCGLVVCEDNTAICDPRKVLMKFGWSLSPLAASARLRPALLKAKSMSLLYEFPRCPIVTELASLGLRLTGGVTPRFEKSWRMYHLEAEIAATWGATTALAAEGVTMTARHQFAQLYNIDVELQLAVEASIRSWDGGYLIPEYTSLLYDRHRDCRHYSAAYVCERTAPPPELPGATTFADLRRWLGE